MSGLASGSNADLSKNDFNSNSGYSFNSKSHQDLRRPTYASDISNRLPNIVFTGPNSLYNRRVGQYDFNGEIGIGNASGLRSLDAKYLTRGASGSLMNSRRQAQAILAQTRPFN